MDLSGMRKEIDEIDRQIVDLLNRRYRIVLDVGKWKQENNMPVYAPEREKMLLERLKTLNGGPMTNRTLCAIYREIMSGAYELERKLHVAYLGPAATYSHQAAQERFGSGVEYVPLSGIAEVFRDVESGKADFGVVPVENSTEGVVNHTLDLLVDSPVRVCGEINLPIHHCLLASAGTKEIRKIYSHPQSFAQCRAWLSEHYPAVEKIETSSNTRAAELAAAEAGSAAVCGELAASIYGLEILERKIEDNPRNTTRFFIIGDIEIKSTGKDKTSICFSVRDRVGALYDCLLPFRASGLTLSMIESRPSRKANWEYVFFVDLAGHISDPVVMKSLDELRQATSFLKILGSYPV